MHLNIVNCPRCLEVLHKYPNFHKELEKWFWTFKTKHPEAHASWGGRGKRDQELFFTAGTSRAHYGQSAHNYNAAIDLFKIDQVGKADFSNDFYNSVLGPEVMSIPWLLWYGAPGAKYYEKPHVEVRDWKLLLLQGKLKLVE